MSPTSTAAGLGLSPIRRMALGAPAGTISLGLGEPGWALPEVAREALARVAREDAAMPYGPNTSSPELVAAVADHHAASHGIPSAAGIESLAAQQVSPDQVMVTSGSQAALFALFLAHVDAGSTVLVPDPGFVSYRSLAAICRAEAVGYPLGAGGTLDAAAIVATLEEHPGVSMVVLNHPSNPTGACASAEQLALVAEACAARSVLLVSDEVYRELWVGERPVSLHDVAGVEAGVVLGSVSKAFGAPGLRVGWAVGSPDVLAPARILHNAMTTATAVPSQAAALALLQAADEVLPAAREELRLRWETVARVAPELLALADGATSHPPSPDRASRRDPFSPHRASRRDRFSPHRAFRRDRFGPTERLVGTSHASEAPRPRAGLYLWLPLPADTDPVRTEEFALTVRDTSRVTTIPGSAFGPRGAGHLRVSIGGPIPELEEGLARLAPWWKA